MPELVQNSVSEGFFSSSDLSAREDEIITSLAKQMQFEPQQLLSRSHYWTRDSKVGAFHYQVLKGDKPAVLKVQGEKPNTSEVSMIKSFARVNKSKILRPPHIYAAKPWNDKQGYEAIVMEEVTGKPMVAPVATDEQLANFFKIHQEYRETCLGKPWLAHPKQDSTESVQTRFAGWKLIRQKQFANHPLKESGDDVLIDQAIDVLGKGYKGVPLEFMHGHFAVPDVLVQGNEAIVLSNLYWSWRPPVYDAIFAYHWHMYGLNDVPNLTHKDIDMQRARWLSFISGQPSVMKAGPKLRDLALLERATAGLNLDALSMNTKGANAQYLVESTRKQVTDLISKLS